MTTWSLILWLVAFPDYEVNASGFRTRSACYAWAYEYDRDVLRRKEIARMKHRGEYLRVACFPVFDFRALDGDE